LIQELLEDNSYQKRSRDGGSSGNRDGGFGGNRSGGFGGNGDGGFGSNRNEENDSFYGNKKEEKKGKFLYSVLEES
jgi:hypothetical protein